MKQRARPAQRRQPVQRRRRRDRLCRRPPAHPRRRAARSAERHLFGMFAIMAALLSPQQDRARVSSSIVAMYEAMLTLIPEAVIDLTLNDADPKRIGNRDRFKAPHGIYPLPRRRIPGSRSASTATRTGRAACAARSGRTGLARRSALCRCRRTAQPTSARSTLAVEGWTRRSASATRRGQAAGRRRGGRSGAALSTNCSMTRSSRRTAASSPSIIRRRGRTASSACRGRWTALASNTAARRCSASTPTKFSPDCSASSEADYARLEADGVLT